MLPTPSCHPRTDSATRTAHTARHARHRREEEPAFTVGPLDRLWIRPGLLLCNRPCFGGIGRRPIERPSRVPASESLSNCTVAARPRSSPNPASRMYPFSARPIRYPFGGRPIRYPFGARPIRGLANLPARCPRIRSNTPTSHGPTMWLPWFGTTATTWPAGRKMRLTSRNTPTGSSTCTSTARIHAASNTPSLTGNPFPSATATMPLFAPRPRAAPPSAAPPSAARPSAARPSAAPPSAARRAIAPRPVEPDHQPRRQH
jgi:hypothetical protein